MKQLFWAKVPPVKVESTIWKSATDDKVKLDVKELEELFGNAPAAKPKGKPKAAADEGGAPGRASVAAKSKVTTLLDMQRSNNVGIMLSRIKMDYPSVKKAILAVDVTDDGLTVQHLRSILGQAPTAEEAEMLREFSGDKSTLGKPEQFFLQIIGVPRLTQRLQTMIFRAGFSDALNAVKPNLATLRDASKAMATSKRFVRLLEIVLAMGNYMNGGSNRGQAYGFKLDTLLKLQDTRAGDRKTTLLMYIVRHVDKTEPDVLKFREDLADVRNAARISLDSVAADLREIKKGLDQVDREVPLAPEDKPEDKFRTKMAAFLASAQKDFDGVHGSIDQVEKAFRDAAVLYGEDRSTSKPEEFFGTVTKFMAHFDAAEKAMRAQQQAVIDAMKGPAVGKGKGKMGMGMMMGGGGGSGGGGGGTGMMDELLAKLAKPGGGRKARGKAGDDSKADGGDDAPASFKASAQAILAVSALKKRASTKVR